MSLPFKMLSVKRWQALEQQQILLENGQEYPIILDTDEELLEILMESFEDVEEDVQELLKQSEQFDAEAWLGQCKKAFTKWPEDISPINKLYFARINEENANDELPIALIPTEHAWQIPCHLKLGGWNEAPQASVQSSVLRYWETQYGAKLRVVSHDTLELTVERPPTTKEEAFKLALQQYQFCPDIVDQGVEKIENLAATLLNGKAWFFWWD